MATIMYKDGTVWRDAVHPVGSLYFSTVSTSPSTLFGGQWSQITGAAIRGYTSVGYVGSDSTTLTVDQIPSHNHATLPSTIYFWATYVKNFPNGNGSSGWGLTNSSNTAFYWAGSNPNKGGGANLIQISNRRTA